MNTVLENNINLKVERKQKWGFIFKAPFFFMIPKVVLSAPFISVFLVGGILFLTGAGLLSQDRATREESDSGNKEVNSKNTPPKLGFRFSAQKKKPAPLSPEKEKLADGAVAVGVVSEQATLPPELKELAQKGTIAVSVQDWDKAREIYLELLKMAPDNALAYANLGVVEHQLKNLSAADANLTKSLKINPMIAQNWLTLGLIQYEKGDLNMAISSLTRAIHEAPNDGQIRLVLAAVIRDYGWEEAAILELKRALMINPKLADAHYNLALSYLSSDPPKLEMARRHYYSAIDLGTKPSPEIEKQLGNTPAKK